MGIHPAERNVAHIERPRFSTRLIHPPHRAIAEIRYSRRPSGMLSSLLCKTRRHKVAAPEIAHIADTGLHIHLRAKQSRILLIEINIVIDNADIDTAKRICVRRRWDVEIIVGSAVLRPGCPERGHNRRHNIYDFPYAHKHSGRNASPA